MEAVKFKILKLRADAYVYVEEQTESNEFYIVREGSLIEENPLNYLTGESDTILRPGDFFGVLDCMSQRPRVSSVRVVEDAVLICVRFDQFETLILNMAPVAMKIIRYFSHQLRKYNLTLSSLTDAHGANMPLNNVLALYELGQFYQEQGKISLAGYAYTRFMEMHPDLKEVHEAKEQIDILNYNDSANVPRKNGLQLTYDEGQPIFLDQENGADLFIILEGHVKITKVTENNEILLGVLRERDIFGEMSIFENSCRSASAIAGSRTTVLKINKQNFDMYIRSHPEIARRIIELLSERIWLIYKRLANQTIADPTAKIYDALNTLLQKNRIAITKGTPYIFEMSPDELIQFIGMEPNEGEKVMDTLIANDTSLNIENNRLVTKDVYNIRTGIASANRNQTRNQNRARY